MRRISHITVYTALLTGGLEPLTLSFQDPSSENPYQVTSLDGLGAEEEIVWVNNVARMQKRVFTIQVKLNPNWTENQTYDQLRDRLFRFIQNTRTGTLAFGFYDGDNVVGVASGKIVKMEPTLLTQFPDIKFTVECRNPLLFNPNLNDPPVVSETIVGGYNRATVTDLISTAPHGGIYTLKCHAVKSSLTILGDSEGWLFRSTFSFVDNDIITISNIDFPYATKSIELTRDDLTIPLAETIDPNSVWPLIYPRVNLLTVTDDITWERIQYPTVYWGL